MRVTNAQCLWILIISQKLYNTKILKSCYIVSEYVWKHLTLNIWKNIQKYVQHYKNYNSKIYWRPMFICRILSHIVSCGHSCQSWFFSFDHPFATQTVLPWEKLHNFCANHTNCYSNLMSELWLLVTHLPNNQKSVYHGRVLLTLAKAFDHWSA